MRENAIKISFLAWLAILLFVFSSCGSKEEKERAKTEQEANRVKDSILEYDLANGISPERRRNINKKDSVAKIQGLVPQLVKAPPFMRPEQHFSENGVFKPELLNAYFACMNRGRTEGLDSLALMKRCFPKK